MRLNIWIDKTVPTVSSSNIQVDTRRALHLLHHLHHLPSYAGEILICVIIRFDVLNWIQIHRQFNTATSDVCLQGLKQDKYPQLISHQENTAEGSGNVSPFFNCLSFTISVFFQCLSPLPPASVSCSPCACLSSYILKLYFIFYPPLEHPFISSSEPSIFSWLPCL